MNRESEIVELGAVSTETLGSSIGIEETATGMKLFPAGICAED